jgi:hypothetical protein
MVLEDGLDYLACGKYGVGLVVFEKEAQRSNVGCFGMKFRCLKGRYAIQDGYAVIHSFPTGTVHYRLSAAGIGQSHDRSCADADQGKDGLFVRTSYLAIFV